MAYINSLRAYITFFLAKKALIALLILKKIYILIEYFNFLDIFFNKLAKLLFKCIRVDKYLMKLEKSN